MTKKPSQAPPGEDLRARAERLLAAKGAAVEKMPLQDVQTLVHELQVHQIELEMQNEELRKTNQELEDLRFKYADLYDFAPVGYFSLDQTGQILEVNLTGARLLGMERDRLIRSPFFLLVAAADRAVFHSHLKEVFNSGTKQTCEIQIEPRRGLPFFASLEGIPVQTGQGPITHCRTMVADITARKQERDALELKKRNESLREALEKTIIALATTTEMRDPHTTGHQRRVSQLAGALAQEMGFTADRVKGMRVMGLLHDIGKMVVPFAILSKPGKLNNHEYEIAKTHTLVGYEILKEIDFPWPVAQAVLQHHERLDGSGYPSGLSSPDIILEAKVLWVADVVDTMVSNMPYRPGLGIDKALEEITRHKGTLYDPEVVDACLRLFTEKKFKFQT